MSNDLRKELKREKEREKELEELLKKAAQALNEDEDESQHDPRDHSDEDTEEGEKKDKEEEEQNLPSKVIPDAFRNYGQKYLVQKTPNVLKFGTRSCNAVSFFEI